MKKKTLSPNHVHKKFDLSGQVAIITGGAGLLGTQHTEAIFEAGGFPVVFDHNPINLKKLTAHFKKKYHAKLLTFCTDVTDAAAVISAVKQTVDRYKRIDILINNASVTVQGASENFSDYFAPFEDYRIDLWEKAVNVGLTGLIVVTQAVGKIMLRRKKGVVINIASTAGVVGPDQRIYQGIKNQYGGGAFNTPIAYSAIKSAIIGMTRYLATYWAENNIRVNALSPGGVYDNHDDKFVANYSYRVPMGRMANRDEYKCAIVYLASEASSYMTGSNLIVDGGWTCW
ncbi:MAG: hypothetical protein COV74_09295 [Candidatus Omnitrophica bacterium CG11_big_fil_rev_8_21_14_0_20_45_26]|uniref:Short-chain dehydrogenase n=1 Tax=Candidatus Abzuiibacterium crystallinum TaxID=1974748 RepID=A0A2H0LNY4_9BACT|nr:MAG: hypothetical protein COV74_09295 [Candidatus Omnitrophica bacterium CG11_big_fil_rev_8_21_14_0_20_45_26]PIW63266.1 MAG: hypothetical protein COW12_11270 [Candidatus Omnitrophica bacterium CG12_big_fil_rev_8_21_14_0_65_45_16]